MLPALVLAAGTAWTWVADVDLALALRYYDPLAPNPFPLGSRPLWVWLYRWAIFPSVLLFVGGLLLAAWAYGDPRGQGARRAGVLLMLALLLGPMLLVNGVFKAGYGRPRPRQVIELGGTQPFRPVLLPTFRGNEDGFPSGHAAAAYAPLVLYFVLRRRHGRVAWAALGASLAFGGVVSYMRMIQGGHFFSDVLWSGGVVYFSAYAVARWQGRRDGVVARRFTRDPPPVPARRRSLVRGGALLLGLLVLGVYAGRLPYFTTLEWRVPVPPGVSRGRIAIGAEQGRLRIAERPGLDALHLRVRIDGRGLPWAAVWDERHADSAAPGDGLTLRYALRERGMLGHYDVRARMEMPPGFTLDVERLAPDEATTPAAAQGAPESAPSAADQ
ncbi:MAG: phosphatase PAP2 family protein [Candidatus Lambdaproteobacteria bacterium]|nr:phosphatase PAP2 family protein [Candidatus Lambdaproteobacteria bacterium]